MAAPPPQKIHSVQPETVFARPVPTLLFPSVWWENNPPFPNVGDDGLFPTRSDLAIRNDPSCILRSLDFISALRTAQLLRIIDLHFDERDGARPLLQVLEQSNLVDISLLTGNHFQNTQQWCATARSLLKQHNNGKAPVVKWKTTLKDTCPIEVHDRFALVDDELWHFGATVGGAHRSINAYSRGWDVEATRAREFFDEVWSYA